MSECEKISVAHNKFGIKLFLFRSFVASFPPPTSPLGTTTQVSPVCQTMIPRRPVLYSAALFLGIIVGGGGAVVLLVILGDKDDEDE